MIVVLFYDLFFQPRGRLAACTHTSSTTASRVAFPIYKDPIPLSPNTIPTPIACPNAPKANTSAAVSPAGSLETRPDDLSDNLSPADAFLFAVGASPKRPATNGRVVERIIIWLVADPRYSARTTWWVLRAWVLGAAVCNKYILTTSGSTIGHKKMHSNIGIIQYS